MEDGHGALHRFAHFKCGQSWHKNEEQNRGGRFLTRWLRPGRASSEKERKTGEIENLGARGSPVLGRFRRYDFLRTIATRLGHAYESCRVYQANIVLSSPFSLLLFPASSGHSFSLSPGSPRSVPSLGPSFRSLI